MEHKHGVCHSPDHGRMRLSGTAGCAILLFFLLPALFLYAGEGVTDGDFLPGFARILGGHPTLADGGGIIVERDGEWIAIGVGVAYQDAGRTRPKRELWRIADAGALSALAEAFSGSVWSGTEEVRQTGDAGASVSVVGETVIGYVSASNEVGRWQDGTAGSYGVMRAVFQPGSRLAQRTFAFTVASDDLDDGWRDEFLSRAFLRRGGVALATRDRRVFLLVVGIAQLAGSAEIPRAIRIAEIKARAELVAYCDGYRVATERTVETLWQSDLTDQRSREMIQEKLVNKTRVQIQGLAGRMESVGGWLAADGRSLARAYVVAADDF